MGQYYKPVSLDAGQWVYSHSIKGTYKREDGTEYTIGQGLKLMEHSYIDNPMMNAVENLLAPHGAWHKTSIVWAGDYADEEVGGGNIYTLYDDESPMRKPYIPVEELDTEKDAKLHYLVNHDAKVYIDLRTINEDEDGYKIHPLSLLTCEGNGRGGGDFRGVDSRIGTWARACISMEYEAPEGYQEVDGTFRE